MQILYAGAEMVPFVKVGGLADVAGALTKELSRLGHGVRALLPVYPSVRRHWAEIAPETAGDLTIELEGRSISGVVHCARIPESGVGLLLVEQDDLFARPNPYVDPETGTDWPDNALRFAFLCHALPAACAVVGWTPDLIHLNDYQLGPVAMLLREGLCPPALGAIPTIYSIHNLGYQGLFPIADPEAVSAVAATQAAAEASPGAAGSTPEGSATGKASTPKDASAAEPGVTEAPAAALPLLAPAPRPLGALAAGLGFPAELAAPTGPLEFYGKLSFMKVGLVYADLITTVSPTYAREIQEPEHGFGLEGVLRDRAGDLIGILNGIDVELWDPQTDPLIPYNFGPSDFQRKRENKARLLEVAHLDPDLRIPLIGMIGRLVEQKGLDLFEEIADSFIGGNEVRMVVLGSGMPRYEALMKRLEERHPRRFAVRLGFDEPLAHLIEAGSDFFLMPSRYEPCGLNQMYSMRYGTVPIVRATGGLADTVTEFDPQAGTGSGFVFREYDPEALLAALERALAAYGRSRAFKSLVTRIMRRDFSWHRAAGEYVKVYERAISGRSDRQT